MSTKILVKGKRQSKPKKKEVKLKDKTYKYSDISELSKKAKITRKQAGDLDQNKNTKRIVLKNNGDFKRFDVSNSLVLQEFDIKRIQNKKLLEDGIRMKDTTILNSIPKDKTVNILIKYEIVFTVSDKVETRRPFKRYECTPADIKPIVREFIIDYMDAIPDAKLNKKKTLFQISSTYSNQTFELKYNRLRDLKPLSLHNIFDNIDLNASENCVKNYLKKKLGKKISFKTIDKLGNELGITPIEIIEFCKIYNIQVHIFKRSGGIECQYIPEKKNKSYPILYILAHNNHCYGINGSVPKIINNDDNRYTVKCIENTKDKILELLNNGIEPGNIKTDGENLISFTDNNIKYLNNKKYDKCTNILKKFGLEEYRFDSINYIHLLNIIEKKYLKEKITSFWPNSYLFSKGGFLYKSTELLEKVDKTQINTIDKNKQYSQALKMLPFIISFDYRTSTIIDKPTEIIEHYLYVVVPKISNVFIPETNIHAGYHLLLAKKYGVEFDILEGITTNKTFNYYTQLVEDLYELIDPNVAKKIIVRGLGKGEQSTEIKTNIQTFGVFNTEESKCHSGFILKINDKYNLMYDTNESITNMYTKKVLSFQVKDMARVILFEKMRELKITKDNLIQINTDSISYIGKLPKNLNPDLFEGWKKQEFKEIKKGTIYYNFNNLSLKMKTITTDEYNEDLEHGLIPLEHENNESKRVCGECLAGAGKTHKIINKIIPNIPKNKSFIVLTPSHVSLNQYRTKKINCNVVHKYSLNNSMPNEDIIIIDELGMCDKQAHDMIFKCFMFNKGLHAYGDTHQLPPINNDGSTGKYNSEQYINYIFNEVDILDTNYRNHFTKEYYKSLYDEEIDFRKEVYKYSTKRYYEAEIILCWFNESVKKYNDMMLNYLKLDKYDVGVKLICITNDLRDKEIYNKFPFTITSNKDDIITLSNGLNFTKKEIDKYFLPGYACTIYAIQGGEVKSYFFPNEPTKANGKVYNDINSINGEAAYTIISRLKTK